MDGKDTNYVLQALLSFVLRRYLWVGGRNHSDIVCWDLRGTRSEVGRVRRYLATNQRLAFDLDPWGAQYVRLLLYFDS